MYLHSIVMCGIKNSNTAFVCCGILMLLLVMKCAHLLYVCGGPGVYGAGAGEVSAGGAGVFSHSVLHFPQQ